MYFSVRTDGEGRCAAHEFDRGVGSAPRLANDPRLVDDPQFAGAPAGPGEPPHELANVISGGRDWLKVDAVANFEHHALHAAARIRLHSAAAVGGFAVYTRPHRLRVPPLERDHAGAHDDRLAVYVFRRLRLQRAHGLHLVGNEVVCGRVRAFLHAASGADLDSSDFARWFLDAAPVDPKWLVMPVQPAPAAPSLLMELELERRRRRPRRPAGGTSAGGARRARGARE